MKHLAFLVLALAAQTCRAADHPVPLARGHAHNDYEHMRPLLDALEQGFCSVEADIFLVDGQLLVAHDARDLRPDRTLEALYLRPLRQRIQSNNGHIYSDSSPFWLMIDIKSDGASTYQVLSKLLEQYADVLTRFSPDGVQSKGVSVVISGNRPRELMRSEAIRYAAVDGRLSDLDSDDPPGLMPWISDNWNLAFKWRGTGEMPAEERTKLRDIVTKAHRAQRKVRFWATPENPAVWRELIAAEVDFINTDKLAELREFLSRSGGC